MFAVTVRFEIHPDQMQAFVPMIQANAQASLNTEPGCQQFDVLLDEAHPNTVFLYEIYDDEAAFQSHMQQTHFERFNTDTAAMIASKDISTFRQVLK